jgi:hypothetical protein
MAPTAVMLAQQVEQRLAGVEVLPTLRPALIELATQDDPDNTVVSPWAQIIPHLYAALGDDESSICPFNHAWMLLVAAMRRLDHLQDGDVPDHPLPTTEQHGAQYNLVFSYYMSATALLDELDVHRLSPVRLLRLRRLWADTLLVAASGQQHDLEQGPSVHADPISLDEYQRIAYAKSGALFALAFSGVATLATDDPIIIATCSFVGHIYGMLVQFKDDIDDVVTQQDAGMNLLRVYDTLRISHNIEWHPHAVGAYWTHVYTAYIGQVDQALVALPADVRGSIRHLFASTFESIESTAT